MNGPFEINTLFIFILFTSFGQTLFASILLLLTKNGDRIANIFLACFMLGLNLCFFLLYIRAHWIIEYAHTAYIYIPMMFILPIILWLYVRRLTHPEKNIKYRHLLLYCIPTFISILLLLPFYSLPNIEKLEWIFGRLDPYYEYTMSTSQQWTTTVMAPIQYLAVFFALIYMVKSTKLLQQHKKIISEQFSYSDNIDLSWLQYLISICGLTYILHFFSLVFFPSTVDTPYSSGAPYILTSIIIVAGSLSIFSYFGLSQKSIFSYSSQLDQIPLSTQHEETEQSTNEKYSSSTLSKEDMEAIKEKLCNKMLDSELFLDPELSIKQVALALDCSARDLSRVINEQLKMTFLEFVNSHRIEYAKKTLLQKKPMTILEIAMAVGFNSKSTFYAVFKKSTGTSPTEFRKNTAKFSLDTV